MRHRMLCCALSLALLSVAVPAWTAEAPTSGQVIVLDGNAGGKRFDGIGVVEGGGATGPFLKDYPEKQREQIFDLVFKPKFGASISALYVEIPGDGNSTQGSMPSHKHTRDDLNYSRGFMWWEIAQAKKRNPALTLDGSAWSAPGWIGDHGNQLPSDEGKTPPDKANFFSRDGADYYVSWLKGLRDVYGFEMTAIGLRNERGVSYDFAKVLRKDLNDNGFAKVKIHGFDNWPDDWKLKFVTDMVKDKALRDAIDIIGAHNNAPDSVTPPEIRQLASVMQKPMWDTEQHVYKPGFDGLISTVKSFNENHIRSGYTKIIDWYGIAGLYTTQPYSGEKEAIVRANWPWSGHYEVNPKIWAYAHYGQFSQVGWQYLAKGSGDLVGGGTYVTLKAPTGDYSVIVETKDVKSEQTVTFSIGKGLSAKTLAVWYSDAAQSFVRQADVKPVKGRVTLVLAPNAVYSLTTTRGQQKGHFDAVPDHAAFPFPYLETFDGYADARAWGYQPHYFADISGAFELASCPGRRGQCLHQSAPVPTHSWAPDWKPYTIIGDDQWQDYEVAADVYLNAGDSAAVMGRINNVGTGYGSIPKGYYLALSATGELRLVVVRGKVDKKKLVGDGEQQAQIKAANDDSAGGEKVLATAQLSDVAPGQWHALKLQFNGASITGLVDGKAVLTATDALYGKGMAGLLAENSGTKLSQPSFDNLLVNRIDGALPPPAQTSPEQKPIYPVARTGR